MFAARSTVTAYPMGMYLNSNQTTSGGQSNIQIAPCTALTAYPLTTITGNKLVANATGNWMLNMTVTASGSWNGMTLTVNAVKNTTTVATVTLSANGSGSMTATAISLVSGDTVWFRYSTGSLAFPTITSGSSSTFISFS